ncbi:MAG: FAD-dependent oxidoreductase [Candidatus Nanopelagicales bacterium]|jgi:glycine/D-amino acid oxidase-like deaminating enzyme|nr:FAD-binding oxidoreductase [Candidatus Nanopelagicales bacterium]
MFSATPSHLGYKKTAALTHESFWLDNPDRPPARPALKTSLDADLVVVGAGFTGLWSALEAAVEHPEWSIVLLEGERIAGGASGRNGGFVAASLTHGFSNGLTRWPNEMPELLRLGSQNLVQMGERVVQLGIDCDWIVSGEIDVATEEYQAKDLKDVHAQMKGLGVCAEYLTAGEIQARVNSPIYQGALFDPNVAIVDPARLAWGLARELDRLGVLIYENSAVTNLEDRGPLVRVQAGAHSVSSPQVILATNAYPPLLKRLKHLIVPVYDYVLVTEPLTVAQRESIGWLGREGVGDAGNLFHYYRVTKDGRILFGGYDAVYHGKDPVRPEFDTDTESFARLADHFVHIFPQLAAVNFTHGWGGAIDTCSRFSAFWGKAHHGKTVYVAGFTGLGVGASRFAALTSLDLLLGRKTERTELRMVRTKPLPFPPEPFRGWVITWTTNSLKKADRENGKRNLWLRLLDSLGLGFDS